jgi:hypothetical protein
MAFFIKHIYKISQSYDKSYLVTAKIKKMEDKSRFYLPLTQKNLRL